MTYEVRMPVLSQSMIQGRVVEWLLNEGDRVEKGAIMVVVESDKATHELEAPHGGIINKILVEAGSEVDVDTLLAIIGEGEELATVPGEIAPNQAAPSEVSAPSVSSGPGMRKPVSPAAKRLAKELGIDTSQVPGSGEGGLVTENDIRAFASKQVAGAATESDDVQVIPLSG